ncbi:MAG TPA: ECF transporter S component [Firmicutes bacterium]|nr:ECF transporter S component [Bacillota bacterium]
MSRTKKIAMLGIFAAISIALALLIRFPIFPAVADLIYEPADVPILIIGFALGPAAGLAVTCIVAILMALLTGLGGPFGALMHFLATGALVGTASVIYGKHHTRSGAVLALTAGTLAMTLVMIPANLILTPIFYGMYGWTTAKVMGVIWWIIAFNLVKAGINSTVTFLLYKRVVGFVRGAALTRQHGHQVAEKTSP